MAEGYQRDDVMPIHMMLRPVKWKRVVTALTLAGVVAVVYLLGTWVRDARKAARQSRAYGGLYQMSFALHTYEEAKGCLPALWQQDDRGRRLHGWRVMLLPILESADDFRKLDLAKPWNSEPNDSVLRSCGAWRYFTGESYWAGDPSHGIHHSTCILALVSQDSMWNAETGLPVARTAACPDRILLISVPHSDIDPWEPRDITEKEVRTRVEQGEEVFFIDAGRKYGKVQIRDGNLVFDRGY